MRTEPNSTQRGLDDNLESSAVAVARGSAEHSADYLSNWDDESGGTINSSAVNPGSAQVEAGSTDINSSQVPGGSMGKRWWVLAAASALLLTGLTVAAVYLVTRKPSTVDQLVILTVPSGADIKLNSKEYGHSPVKLEQLAIGTYTLSIFKEGFEPIEQPLTVTESGPVEYKLRPVIPPEATSGSAGESIGKYQQLAEAAFARGVWGLAYEGSALNYADFILYSDPNNVFALEMRERVRKTAHQSAVAAISRGDLAQAQDIYIFLVAHYNDDQEAKAGAARLEIQLQARRGKVDEFVRKAGDALQAGRLTEPAGASAYYYSHQALAIDRQNDKARQIRNQVKDRLAAASEDNYSRGDFDSAIKSLEQTVQLFPDDKQIRARLREMVAGRTKETAKASDPNARRIRGLDLYQHEDFAGAIPDLESAVSGGRGTAEVVFALARSYWKIGKLDRAESYFLQVPRTADDSYRSSIAALGDIALQRGDSSKAVERYKEARELGGSPLYTPNALDDKIEKIERRQREKAAEPTPLTIHVSHLHGGLLGGSCRGTLTVNSTGVRYDGEHVFSANFVGVGVNISKDEMQVSFQGKTQKFKAQRAEAESFREALVRYQQYYSPASK